MWGLSCRRKHEIRLVKQTDIIRNCCWAIVKMQIKESLLRLILNDNVSSIKWLVIIFKYKIQIERHIADCGCRNSYFKWKFSYINGDWRTPAIIRHMTGAPLYWEAFSTCQLVLLSSVSNIMLNKCSNHMKTLRRGGGRWKGERKNWGES